MKYAISAIFLASLALVVACGKASSGKTAAGPSPSEPEQELCGTGLQVSPEAPVATVDGESISCSELFARDQGAIRRAEAEFREKVRAIHEQSLLQLVNDRLLQNEADKAQMPVEKFIASTVKATPATPEEMKSFYEQALAAGETLPPMEEIESELSAFLNQQKQKSALSEFRASLREKAEVELKLPPFLPPRVEVAAEGVSKGPEKAPVTIVEFADFECGFCRKAESTVQKILDTYGDKVRLVYRDYPLPNHPAAAKAAEAGHCADKQGKYWEMHARLFDNPGALSADELKRHAGELGLDQASFDACLDEGATRDIVAASLKEGERLGITGTPAFFVNGRMLTGAQPFERFQEIIDYELGASKE